ncbi:unnamed protein product [Camellia sinensis]
MTPQYSEREDSRISIKVKRQLKKSESLTKLYDDERRSRSRSYERRPSPRRTPPSRGGSPDGHNHKECSPTLKSVSLCGRPADSQSPSRHSNADVRIGSDILCDESSARILLVILCVVETALGEDILRFSMLLSDH